MQLRIHNEGWVYFVISCLITIIVIPFYTILGIFLSILSAYIFYFFRDPIRAVPTEEVVATSGISPEDLARCPGWDEATIQAYLDQGWTMDQLAEYYAEQLE